jgi:hypothetical protein
VYGTSEATPLAPGADGDDGAPDGDAEVTAGSAGPQPDPTKANRRVARQAPARRGVDTTAG